MTNLTEGTLALFVAYANDAGNWGGTPLVGGNVKQGPKENSHLTDLKKAGLVYTDLDGDRKDLVWLYFTDKGRALAESLNIPLY